MIPVSQSLQVSSLSLNLVLKAYGYPAAGVKFQLTVTRNQKIYGSAINIILINDIPQPGRLLIAPPVAGVPSFFSKKVFLGQIQIAQMEVINQCNQYLKSTVQLFLALIIHPEVSVACTLTPSIIRFIHFLKSQKTSTARREGAFIGQDYVTVLLPSFLRQARYPKDFPFALCEVEQEDVWEIAEVCIVLYCMLGTIECLLLLCFLCVL